METYIGLFSPKGKLENGQINQKLKDRNYNIFHQCDNLLLANKDYPIKEENYFADGKSVVYFSGDCYNEAALIEQASLEGDGISFAEALASLLQMKGEQIIQQIRGNFTLIFFEKVKGKIHLFRDQFGTKLLFYKRTGENFSFSNMKKELLFLHDEKIVSKDALNHYLSFQYVPDPFTLSKNINIVSSGNVVTIDSENQLTHKNYYERSFHPVITERHFWIKRIREALYESVATVMDGNDSIGSFLSGGIDSTLIASIAKEIKPDLKTFSVGFERDGFSEIDVAKESASKLELENFSKVITPEEYMNQLPEIVWHLDDPLADPACVPLYFVAKLAKTHVDNALSGEGADEFFGGYNIYREPESLKMFNYIPPVLKGGLNKLASALPDHVKGKSFLERGTTPLYERYIGNAKIFNDDEKKRLLQHYDERVSYKDITGPFFDKVQEDHPTAQMQYVDIHTWLPGDILLKASKMSRANSLKVRMPFIDINVFDVARELPVHLTIANRTTKHILREAARGIVPDHVLERKKLGFPVPIRHWLKDELYDWAKTLIHESETEEFLNKSAILDLLESHVQGREDASRKLWTIFMFMIWHQVFIEEKYNFND